MAQPRLTLIDARLVFFTALVVFHIRWWTVLLLVVAFVALAVAGQMNYAPETLWGLLKNRFMGTFRLSCPTRDFGLWWIVAADCPDDPNAIRFPGGLSALGPSERCTEGIRR